MTPGNKRGCIWFYSIWEYCLLKVPLKSNSRNPFFYIFVHNKSFRKILPKFKLLRTSEHTFFGPLFPRIYGRHYFTLFQVLVEKWSRGRHTLKNSTRVEVIITIKVENCTNIRAKFSKIAVITYFFLVTIKQRINDHALNFQTFHSRISSWHPLADFNSFLNYW